VTQPPGDNRQYQFPAESNVFLERGSASRGGVGDTASASVRAREGGAAGYMDVLAPVAEAVSPTPPGHIAAARSGSDTNQLSVELTSLPDSSQLQLRATLLPRHLIEQFLQRVARGRTDPLFALSVPVEVIAAGAGGDPELAGGELAGDDDAAAIRAGK